MNPPVDRQSRKFLIGSAAALMALTAGLALWWASPVERAPAAEPAAPQLRWVEASLRAYTLAMHTVVSGAVAVEQDISATLSLRVFEVASDRVELGFQLAPVTYMMDGVRDTARETALSTAFGATFAPDGRPQLFHFGEGMRPEVARQLEEIVRTFEVVVPSGAGQSWMAIEEHGAGRYRAGYARLSEGVFRKRKVGYVEGGRVSDGEAVIGTTETRILDSEGTFELAVERSWLDSITIDDTLALSTDGNPLAETELHASLRALPGPVDAGLALVAAWAQRDLSSDVPNALIAPEPVPVAVSRTPASEADRARFRRQIADYDAAGGEGVALLHAIRDMLLEFPELAALIPDIVAEGTISDAAAAGLLHALELAGNPESQQALGSVIGDRRHTHGNRLRALVALGGVERATPAAVAGLWLAAGDRADAESADLANTAVLSVGRIGKELRERDATLYAELRARLVAELGASGDAETASIALKAIGNTFDPDLAPAATDRLSAAEPRVRAAAAEALGTVGDRDSVRNLTASLRREPDGRVRTQIALSLGSLKAHDQATLSTIDAMITGEKDGDARYQMARVLADNLEAWPAGRATLKSLLENETEARTVRYVAGKLYR